MVFVFGCSFLFVHPTALNPTLTLNVPEPETVSNLNMFSEVSSKNQGPENPYKTL